MEENNLKSKRQQKLTTDNPCLKEQEQSYKCLDNNNYNADKCVLQFENYKVCKAFWNEVRIDRMRRGIEPYIPPPEERSQILKEKFTGKKMVYK